MAQLCNSAMMEGLRLRTLGVLHDGANNMKQNYTKVGLDVHGSGWQGGEINDLWKTRA